MRRFQFLGIMLNEYPQVRPLFNQANQTSGDQPRALANAVINYALFIDRLDQISGVVESRSKMPAEFCLDSRLSGPVCCGPSGMCWGRPLPMMR
ncbi:MAG: hypothetical protein U5M72_08765 [Pseudomonas sp.]|nr:hypothetical protein [Pseudomonas sp.]